MIQLFVSFLILSLIFTVIEKKWPSIHGKKVFRRGYFTDLCYWFFTPLVTKVFAQALPMIVVALMFIHLLGESHLTPRELAINQFIEGYGPLSQQPMLLICFEMLIIIDLITYWGHRTFHSPALWRFHSVHHASQELDWLSSVRIHPFNSAIMRLWQFTPLLLLGFPLKALAIVSPVIPLYAILLHANVDWKFGPLKYVIASPAFHRWHHTSQEQGRDKNFAGFFPFIDILFGTFYLPDEKPMQFGVNDASVPNGFLRQMIFPFRKN